MKKRKLKIAIFHLGFFFSGGGEKLVLEEAKGLINRGHLVDIYAPVVDEKHCFPDIISNFDIRNLFLKIPLRIPLRDFISISFSVFISPLLFFKFRKYDVFFGANQPGPVICWILGKILRKPYLIYLAQPTRIVFPREIDLEEGFGKGSFDLFYFFSKIFYPLVKYIDVESVKNANKILANGKYISRILNEIYEIPVTNCPAGCHPRNIKALNHPRFTGPIRIKRNKINKPFILLTNRHFPQKRFDYIISSMPFILSEVPDVELVITGGFTFYTEYLKTLSNQLGIKDKVKFLGLVSENDLVKLYQNAAVYVYTAPQEDFGMGVIEAMASGTPVVAWDNAGPSKTIVNRKSGYLIKPFDVAAFSGRVVSLLKNKYLHRKISKESLIRSEKFSYAKHLDILENALLEVVGDDVE